MILKIGEVKSHKKYRAKTISAAMARIIDTAIIDEPVVVEKMSSYRGREIPNNSMRMLAARMCREQGIDYKTFTGDNGEFIFVRYS